jgi:hypothetical protein
MIGLALAVSAFAQTAGTTSPLSGIVTTDGKPLPGVTVTVTSPSLQGTRTATTGEGGGYTFPALPPGNYSVQFSLEGMQTLTKKVTLALASPARADAALRVGGITESITVTASAPAVLETTQVGMNFKAEMISKLPVARDIRQTVLLAPGVSPNGVNRQITINGGPSYDNVFLVNGVVVNENLRGQPHSLFIEDAIQAEIISAVRSATHSTIRVGRQRPTMREQPRASIRPIRSMKPLSADASSRIACGSSARDARRRLPWGRRPCSRNFRSSTPSTRRGTKGSSPARSRRSTTWSAPTST